MQPQKNTYSDVYGSEFLSPDDLPAGKQIQVRIVSNNVQDVEGFANGKKLDAHTRVVFTCTDMKGNPCKAKIVCNKTSAKRLRTAWGENFSAWVNKTIQVESGKVNGKPAVLLMPVQEKA